LNAILSAVGGSLGLFLGFSCLHVVEALMSAAKVRFGLALFKRKEKDEGKVDCENEDVNAKHEAI